MFRDYSLNVFRWAELVHLDRALSAVREHTLPHATEIPDFILYSLPDGVWVFSYTALFARLWPDGPLAMRLGWIWLGAALAIGGELGQLVQLVPGTFDPIDMLAYTVAAVAGYLVARRL